MIGDEDAHAALTQILDDLLNICNGERINARERLIEQDELRLKREAACNLDAAALTTRQLRTTSVANMSDVKLLEESVELVLLLRLRKLRRLKDCLDVLRDGQLAKDGRFLRKIADPQPRTPIHGIVRDTDVGEIDIAVRGFLKTDDHVKCGRLARAIGTQEANDLALVDTDRDTVNNGAAAKLLNEAAGFEMQDKAPSLAYGCTVIREIDGHVIAARHVVSLEYPCAAI